MSQQAPLDDGELAAVLNWIVTLFGAEAVARSFTPFTAEEVARVRRPPLLHVSAVRASLLACTDAPPRECGASLDR